MITNDATSLQPRTPFDDQLLEFDFPGTRIGVADYAEEPTGCTVFHFPRWGDNDRYTRRLGGNNRQL